MKYINSSISIYRKVSIPKKEKKNVKEEISSNCEEQGRIPLGELLSKKYTAKQVEDALIRKITLRPNSYPM